MPPPRQQQKTGICAPNLWINGPLLVSLPGHRSHVFGLKPSGMIRKRIRPPYQGYILLSIGNVEAVGKRPSAALPSSPALLNSRYARRQSRFNRASHCDVLLCTPRSSGFVRASLVLPTLRAGPRFRKPCIWSFSIGLSETFFGRCR